MLKVSEKGSFFRNYYRAAQYEGALAKGSILVPSEIFSVYHLPIPKNQLIPRLEIERFRRIPISKDILLPNFDEKEHLFLGKNDYSTRIIPFALDNQARFRHIFTIGQTGVGKSTAMVNSILQDIWHGRGCCVIDPHGDLVDDIMKHFPDPSIPGNPDRTKDVIYIDFADEKNFVGINLLEVDSEAEITVVITSLSNMLKKLYPESGESMGPVFQKYLSGVFRTALLTRRRGQKNGLYDPTITIALRLLSNKDYRQFAIQKLEDMEFTGKVDLLNFWKEHEKITGEKSKSQAKDEMSLHIITKFQNFIDNMFIGNIVNQKQSRVNFAEAMDSNKIILCRMNKGQL